MRNKLALIQQDTLNFISKTEKLFKSVEYSRTNTKLYEETHKFEPKNQKSSKFNISMSNFRTFQSVKHLFLNKNLKTCVLNFANAYNPGGGAIRGARAQEESLCRASTLYPCLNTKYLVDNYYNYHNKLYHETNRLFYVPKIIVFKTDEDMYPELMNENDWYEVDVITCAAHNQYEDVLSGKKLFKLNYYRIKQILGSAIDNNVDNIILGAFGCGAFSNDPEVISSVFKKILIDEEYFKYFVNVHFAIFCANTETENFIEFKKVFHDFLIEIENNEIEDENKAEKNDLKNENEKNEKINKIKDDLKEKFDEIGEEKKENNEKSKEEEVKKEKTEEEKKEKLKEEELKKEKAEEDNKEKKDNEMMDKEKKDK
jgi:uncharacterized protein (TIGR02452 family)